MPNGLTDQTLANLRTAAALLLVCPGLAVIVGVEGRAVVEARRPPIPETDHPIVPVCAFHRCVAKAHGLRRGGQQVQMVGVDGDLEPVISLHADDDGIRMIPGGVVRRSNGGRWHHLLAVSVPVEVVEVATAELLASRTAADRDIDLTLHVDRMLDVTVVVVESPIGDKRAARDAIDAIEQVASMATIEWLVESLDPGDVDVEAAALSATGAAASAAGPRPIRRADAPSAGSVRGERSNP